MMNPKNIYAKLGIKTLINAQGTYTTLGGSLMPPEVLQAMTEAAGWFVSIPELQEKVGAGSPALLKVPAAMVTAGAASAITVATAACMTREKPAAIDKLPETDGLRERSRSSRRATSAATSPRCSCSVPSSSGSKRSPSLKSAINPRTAMLFFLNRYEPLGQIKRQDWIRAGKEHAVPVFNDAAADVPPAGRLSEYVHQGFDLVAFSGGKGLRGPQASGLLARPRRPDRGGPPGHQSPDGHRPRDESRQGRNHRPAGRRRAIPHDGPRGRVAALGNTRRRDDRHARRVSPESTCDATSRKSPTIRPTF